jgi:microcystin-dependent protein
LAGEIVTLVATLLNASHYGIGDTFWWGGSFAVTGEVIVAPGYLACNGAQVDRTTYAKLFAEIGFAYSPTPGTDPGSNKFYLPDSTDGQQLIPKGGTNFPTRGAKGGARTVALAPGGSQDAPHTHLILQYNMTIPGGTDGNVGPLIGAEGQTGYGGHIFPNTSGVVGGSGGNAAAHQNMPPVRVVGGKIIRFQ